MSSALKDSNTNLNTERKVLDVLMAKLESGDYAMSSTSTAGKRKLVSEDDAMSSAFAASKRKSTD